MNEDGYDAARIDVALAETGPRLSMAEMREELGLAESSLQEWAANLEAIDNE